jgi:hypothetical protein
MIFQSKELNECYMMIFIVKIIAKYSSCLCECCPVHDIIKEEPGSQTIWVNVRMLHDILKKSHQVIRLFTKKKGLHLYLLTKWTCGLDLDWLLLAFGASSGSENRKRRRKEKGSGEIYWTSWTWTLTWTGNGHGHPQKLQNRLFLFL